MWSRCYTIYGVHLMPSLSMECVCVLCVGVCVLCVVCRCVRGNQYSFLARTHIILAEHYSGAEDVAVTSVFVI